MHYFNRSAVFRFYDDVCAEVRHDCAPKITEAFFPLSRHGKSAERPIVLIVRTKEKSAENLLRVEDIDKGERIDFFYFPRNFLHFVGGDDRIYQIALDSQIAPLAFEDRRIVVRNFVNRSIHVVRAVCNDKKRRLLITLVYGIEQLRR